MIRIAAAAALAAGLGSCSLFDYSGMVSHKYALVYGVTAYSTAVGAPNLQFPHMDASAIAAVLASNKYTVVSRWVDASGTVFKNGVPAGNIGQPQYDSGGNFTDPGYAGNEAPTEGKILSDIQGIAGVVGPNDVVVVYFSGHGTQDTSSSPPREYFDPYESVAYFAGGSPPGFYDNPATSVRDDELAAVFGTIGTPRKVLVLDTCNSGGFIGNLLEVDTTPTAYTGGPPLVGPGTLFQAISNYASMQSSPTGLSPYGAQVLSAAGRDESCYETSSLGHGVMTYYLLQGLLGSTADLNHDGHVTVLEAFSYAKAGIDTNWNPTYLPQGQAFEPHISGGPVDFMLF
jgi:hypothetical protein